MPTLTNDDRGIENPLVDPDNKARSSSTPRDVANDLLEQETKPLDDVGMTPLNDEEKETFSSITGSLISDETSEGPGFKYNPNPTKKRGVRAKFGEKLKVRKFRRRLLIAGIPGVTIIIVMIAGFIFVSSLKIPHFTENIAMYQFSRLSRNFGRSVANVTEEKIALDAADETFSNTLKTKYGNLRSSTWGKLDKYRPQKVINNMKASDQLEYLYRTEDRRIKIPGITSDTKEVLDGIKIGNEELRFGSSDRSLLNFVGRYKERLEFKGRMTAQINEALRGTGTLTRGKVATELRESLGIKLRRWERLTKSYRSGKEAQIDSIRKTAQDTRTKPKDGTGVDAINEAEKSIEKQTEECLRDDDCLKQIANDDGDAFKRKLSADIAAKLGESNLVKTVGAVSGFYRIALPMCMIYEASVVKSGPTVDANSERAQKTWGSLAAAADQQKDGTESNAAQIGGLADELGDTSNTPSEIRASGRIPSLDTQPNPEASQAMDYSIFDALFGGTAGMMFDKIAKPSCPKITDPNTAAAITAAELAVKAAVAAGTLGTGAGGIQAGEKAAEYSVKQVLGRMIKDTFNKKALKTMGKTAIRDSLLIGGGAVLSKVIVHSRMGNMASSIPTGSDLTVQADQGANITANEIGRKQLYSAPMSEEDRLASNYQDRQDIAYANSQKSLFDRYLNPKNANSAFSNTALSLQGGLTKSLTSTFQGWISKIGNIFQPMSLMVLATGGNQSALAATTDTDYRIVQWGWTAKEEAYIREYPDLYSPGNNAELMERSGKFQELKDKYDKCFTSSIGELLANRDIERDENGLIIDNRGLCAPDNLSFNNPEAFSYRVYMRNQNTLDHLNGISDLVSYGSTASSDNPSGNIDCNNVTGNEKIICAAKNYLGVRYANYSSGGTDWNQEWGVTVRGSLGQNPAQWIAERVPGGDNDFLECSGFTKLAIYAAFNVTVKAACSAAYLTDTESFRQIDLSEIRPGDLLIESKECGNGGHIAIYVGKTSSGTLSTLESSAGRNITTKEKKSGYYEHQPGVDFKYAVRYIGPGSSP